MMRSLKGWWLAVGSVPLVWALLALDPFPTVTRAVMRIAALLGYSSLFLASLSALWMRELTRRCGRPFLRIHHTLVITAWIGIGVHVGSAAWESASLSVLIPNVSSLEMFLTLGGRPALYGLVFATLVAVYRARIGKSWKQWHWVSYLAFALVSFHALLLGASFQHPAARAFPIGWVIALSVSFILRRRMGR